MGYAGKYSWPISFQDFFTFDLFDLNTGGPLLHCTCSSFIFKVNHVFMGEKDNPLEKVVIVEKEIDSIEKDGV